MRHTPSRRTVTLSLALAITLAGVAGCACGGAVRQG